MKDKKPKTIFHKNLNPTRDKNDHKFDKFKGLSKESQKALEQRANEILEKYPVPQWIMDL